MFSRVIFVFLFCFSIGCAIIRPKVNPEQDPIFWQREQPLVWEDFRAKPELNSKNVAISSLSIEINITDYPINEAQIIVKAMFYPNKSSVNPNNKNIGMLTHEIYHFHIEEVFARKMRMRFDTTIFSPFDIRKQIWAIRQEVLDSYTIYQNSYDYETHHSIFKKQQLEWQEKIDRQLNELEEYADPKVKIKVAEIKE